MRTNSELEPLRVDVVRDAFETRWKPARLCQDSAIKGARSVARAVRLPTVVYV